MKAELIKQGEYLPFTFDRDGRSIEGWTCNIQVKEFPSDSPYVNRPIQPTGSVWSGYLTSTETATLDPGFYFLTATLTESVEDQEEVVQLRFQVSPAWYS